MYALHALRAIKHHKPKYNRNICWKYIYYWKFSEYGTKNMLCSLFCDYQAKYNKEINKSLCFWLIVCLDWGSVAEHKNEEDSKGLRLTEAFHYEKYLVENDFQLNKYYFDKYINILNLNSVTREQKSLQNLTGRSFTQLIFFKAGHSFMFISLFLSVRSFFIATERT